MTNTPQRFQNDLLNILEAGFPSSRGVRVVKEIDSKSIGLCPHRFESCPRRTFCFCFSFRPRSQFFFFTTDAIFIACLFYNIKKREHTKKFLKNKKTWIDSKCQRALTVLERAHKASLQFCCVQTTQFTAIGPELDIFNDLFCAVLSRQCMKHEILHEYFLTLDEKLVQRDL